MTTSPPLFTKREKYSLALFSMAFIAVSAAVHMMVGGMGYGMLPQFKVEPTPPPQFIVLVHTSKPKPTPTPHPTPTPPPPKVIPPRLPAIHLPKDLVRSDHTAGPTEQPYVQPTEAVVAPSAPPVLPSAQPIASATPAGPLAIREGTFSYKAPLEYPQIDIDRNTEGTVVVIVTIGTQGELLAASVAESSGDANLDAAALAAARASRYTPYLVNGVPVVQQYKIVYDFRLNQ